MRLFVGIPLAATVISKVEALVARLRPVSEGLRWMPPESWHITLQFLGNTDREHCDCVIARLGEVRSTPVPVQVEGLGAFERAGVLYAGVSASRELVSLAEGVVMATGQCGFQSEDRPFHPHMTLARVKGHGQVKPLRSILGRAPEQTGFSRFVAPEFVLYESFTEREGARYEIRARFSLTAG